MRLLAGGSALTAQVDEDAVAAGRGDGPARGYRHGAAMHLKDMDSVGGAALPLRRSCGDRNADAGVGPAVRHVDGVAASVSAASLDCPNGAHRDASRTTVADPNPRPLARDGRDGDGD